MLSTLALTEIEKIKMELQTRKSELEELYINATSVRGKTYFAKREAVMYMIHACNAASDHDLAVTSAKFTKASEAQAHEAKYWIARVLKALTIR